ncbi:TonB family protein [Mesorhizobium sp. CAU 1741]|uniref:TonB family protein n=1 Tax=Mesorhizobium sp. CAU 1741 TaxID=3140366 RepID=UPI00325AF941
MTAAYADIAWSRHLTGTSRGQLAVWTFAALVMLGAHAGAAWWVMRTPAEPLAQIAGSTAIEVDLAALGFSEVDQVSAGETAEAVEPVQSQPVETVDTPETPRETPVETSQAQPVERTQPVEDAQPTQQPTIEQAQPVDEVEPTRQPVVEPEEPVTTETAPSPVSRLAEAASDVEIAAAPPVDNEATIVPEAARPAEPEMAEPAEPQAAAPLEATPIEPTEAETVEPVEQEQISAIADVPLPTPRPDYTPPPPPQRTERPRREQPRQQARPAAGASGQNQADARRGTSQGSAQGRSASQSAGNQRSREAGNAAVSNYPGQIVRKLRRAVRPVRGRERGQVVVSFTVSSSGGVNSVRIARGSGSPNLDQAAVDTVRRAAPFPPIPPAAGRSSWTFNLPIAFTR